MALAEILVALVLFGAGLAGVLKTNFELSQTLARNRRAIQADYLLQDRLASLASAGYEALEMKLASMAPAKGGSPTALFPDSAPVPKNSDFRWNAALSRESAEGNRRIRMEVSVSWAGAGAGRERKAVGYVFAP